ncbi:hypothetical protein HDU86_000767 [Geranomyces michiganensis]|nr:hypothetical protein HDU86_000767 [Geranomyces michiganensis]
MWKTGGIWSKPRTPLPFPGPQCPPIPPPTPRPASVVLDKPPPRLSTLVVDFDGTLTTHDTLSALAALANTKYHSSALSSSDASPTWSELVNKYTDELALAEAAAATITDLSAYLASFRDVERRSVTRVSDSRVLRGITKPAIHTAGKAVEFRTGAGRVLTRWQERRQRDQQGEAATISDNGAVAAAVVVNSVNWSKDLVSAQLDPRVVVLCNELQFDGQDVSTGVVEGNMLVAADKLDAVLAACPKLDGCVAVGDSQTDLLVLLAAEIGIIMAPGEDMIKTCDRFHIELDEISQCPGSSKRGSRLYVAANWDEIEQLLERLESL